MAIEKGSSIKFFLIIIVDLFQASLILYLLLLLIEQYHLGFASNFFNINWLLWIIFPCGIFMLLFHNKEKDYPKKINLKLWDYLFIIIAGVLSGTLVYLKIHDFKWIALVISILSCLMIWSISYLIIKDEQ